MMFFTVFPDSVEPVGVPVGAITGFASIQARQSATAMARVPSAFGLSWRMT
ncbi:unannotated protein [freshwater metagenome]|uniref:Unannotated protein n=1 Tax=freshwater metagenome TaxID=449393 RepID=A0A6J7LL13_9ZZZZ